MNMPKVNIKITTENKCSFCEGSKCCTYVTQPIDTPRSKDEFDYLLWQVSHENVAIYKSCNVWYMLIAGNCNHLLSDGRCGIYETRPRICRDHTNDFCEYDQDSLKDFDLYFPDYTSLLKYCKKRYKTWGK